MLDRVMDDGVEPAAEDIQLPRVLAALADPHRLAAVRFVAANGESWCAQVIQEAGLPMTKPTFSHHLRILREAGIVTKRHEGTRGYMSLRKADLDRRFPGLIDSIVSAAPHPAAPHPAAVRTAGAETAGAETAGAGTSTA